MANELVKIADKQAKEIGNRTAYKFCWRKAGEWLETTWEEFAIQVKVAGNALCALGIKEKDSIAICSPNTPQILITEMGAFRNRVACVPVYATSSQSQLDYIVTDSGANIIFVGDSNQYPMAYDYWKRHPQRVRHIIIFKNDGLELFKDDEVSMMWDDFLRCGMNAEPDIKEEVETRIGRGLPEDPATLIYTSGTTGKPKGVVLTHSNYDAAMRYHMEMLTRVKDDDVSMAFLPMSHIFEKAWDFYCITRGITIAVNYDPRNIQETIKEVKPNIMMCVPRFWEKVNEGVKEKISGMSVLQKMLVKRAIKIGKRRNCHYRRLGLKVPSILEKEYQFWDKKVFVLLRNAIGIPEPNFFPTAGAPLSPGICEFMRSVGIDVKIGYGLSETTATVSCFPDVGWEIGTVGCPLEGVKVRIAENGEILVKGPTITPGYYKNPEANAEAFTEDGFFRTGDAGYFTPDGAIVLTERIKDLFKTSNGKYIAPQLMESRLAENKYISEAVVIGDRRKFVTALIVPNMNQLKAWAATQKIDTADTIGFVNDKRTVEFIMNQIEQQQKDVASFEKIKRITILPTPFTMESGELTNTLKVRRRVVAQHYASQIEAMYSY